MKKIKIGIVMLLGAMLLSGCSVGKKNISISPYILIDVSGLSGRAGAVTSLTSSLTVM